MSTVFRDGGHFYLQNLLALVTIATIKLSLNEGVGR